MEAANTDHYLRINELKNYVYCPRMPFYALVMRLDRATGHAEAGVEAERETRQRMSRRRGALHAVSGGERRYDVPLHSHRLRLVGKLDEMVVTPEGLHLIDYKDSEKDYGYWRIQMMAYRLCAEECLGQAVLGCHIYSIPEREYHSLDLTARDLSKLEKVITDIEATVTTERCPPPVTQSGKCRSCQYRRFCNDVS